MRNITVGKARSPTTPGPNQIFGFGARRAAGPSALTSTAMDHNGNLTDEYGCVPKEFRLDPAKARLITTTVAGDSSSFHQTHQHPTELSLKEFFEHSWRCDFWTMMAVLGVISLATFLLLAAAVACLVARCRRASRSRSRKRRRANNLQLRPAVVVARSGLSGGGEGNEVPLRTNEAVVKDTDDDESDVEGCGSGRLTRPFDHQELRLSSDTDDECDGGGGGELTGAPKFTCASGEFLPMHDETHESTLISTPVN